MTRSHNSKTQTCHSPSARHQKGSRAEDVTVTSQKNLRYPPRHNSKTQTCHSPSARHQKRSRAEAVTVISQKNLRCFPIHQCCKVHADNPSRGRQPHNRRTYNTSVLPSTCTEPKQRKTQRHNRKTRIKYCSVERH